MWVSISTGHNFRFLHFFPFGLLSTIFFDRRLTSMEFLAAKTIVVPHCSNNNSKTKKRHEIKRGKKKNNTEHVKKLHENVRKCYANAAHINSFMCISVRE